MINYIKELNYLLIKHIFPNFESFRLAVLGDKPLTGDEEKIYDTICLIYAYNNVAYETGQELIDNMKLDWDEKFATYIDLINFNYKDIDQKELATSDIKKGFATIQIEDGEDKTDHNQKLETEISVKEKQSVMSKSTKTTVNRIAVQNLFGEYFSFDIRDFPYCPEEE